MFAFIARALHRHFNYHSSRPQVATFASFSKGGATPFGNPFPRQHIVSLQESYTRNKRIIIIGDVHGCSQELEMLLLDRCAYQKGQDIVISVGDLVNKGPDNAGVLKIMKEHEILGVRGNHDDRALTAYLKSKAGKPATKEKLLWVNDLESAEVLESLPFIITLPVYKVAVVHAGVLPGKSLQRQKPLHLLTMRDVVPIVVANEEKYGDSTLSESEMDIDADDSTAAAQPEFDWQAYMQEAAVLANYQDQLKTNPDSETTLRSSSNMIQLKGLLQQVEASERRHAELGRAWASVYQGPLHVIFGHDAGRSLQIQKWATGIDGGCVYGGHLYAAILPPLDEAGNVVERNLPEGAEEITLGTGLKAHLVKVEATAVHCPPKSD